MIRVLCLYAISIFDATLLVYLQSLPLSAISLVDSGDILTGGEISLLLSRLFSLRGVESKRNLKKLRKKESIDV